MELESGDVMISQQVTDTECNKNQGIKQLQLSLTQVTDTE